jgi:hypothetical protein
MPNVGIFFVVNSHILIDAVPLAQAEQYGNTLGYGGHYEYWENLQAINAEQKIFKTRAYDAFARGRVVYFVKQQYYVVYTDECLTRAILTKIAHAFDCKRPAHSPLFTHRRQWQQLIKATFWPRG